MGKICKVITCATQHSVIPTGFQNPRKNGGENITACQFCGSTCYVRVDLNDYSIPHTHLQRLLRVRADPKQVRVLDGAQVLVCHLRRYDKGAQVEEAAHIQALVDDKRAARRHHGTDQLPHATPASQALLT